MLGRKVGESVFSGLELDDLSELAKTSVALGTEESWTGLGPLTLTLDDISELTAFLLPLDNTGLKRVQEKKAKHPRHDI